jgi:hypothetical protein
MSRRYKRREFLIDASFMAVSSVLLNVFAVPKTQEPTVAIANSPEGRQ